MYEATSIKYFEFKIQSTLDIKV